MQVTRRALLAGATAAAVTPAHADTYPSKPIRLIIGYVPGGTTDYAARIIAEGLTRQLGQTVVVENRPGAETAIATEYVVKSPADGYTLAVVNEDGTAMLSAEKSGVPYKIPDDFSFISRVLQITFFLAASTKLPITSMAELVTYAKANPGKLRYGSVGVGSATHLTGVLLEKSAGIQLTHVPYRGAAPAMTDLLGGFIDLSWQTLATIGDQTSTGKIRLLATTGDARDPHQPDVPTMAQAGYPGAAMATWLGVVGPAGLSPEVLDRLRQATTAAIADPAVQQRYAKLALTTAPLVGDAFKKLVTDQYQQWKTICAQEHIVLD